MIAAHDPIVGTICIACGRPLHDGHTEDCPVPDNRWELDGDCARCHNPLNGDAALEPQTGFVHPECTQEGS
jgi:predicted amidophosphoribosyltransferase